MRDGTHETETRKTAAGNPATRATPRQAPGREGSRRANLPEAAGQETVLLFPLPDPGRPLAEQVPAVLLAMGVFGEARGERQQAQRAVAQVVLNRAKNPHPVFGSRAGASLADNLRRVLLRPGQFSSFYPRDPNYPKLLRPLDFEPRAVWEQCLRCAQETLAGAEQEDPLTSNSDHYFDDSIQPPSWADPAKRTVKLDRLNFYRLYLPPPGRPPGAPDAPFSERSGALSPDLGPAQESPASQTIATGRPSPAAPSLPGLATRRKRREYGLRQGSRPLTGLLPHLPRCTRAFGITENGWVLGGRGLSSLGQAGRRGAVRRSGVLALVLLCGLLTACSDLERTAYRTLSVTRTEYELIQQQAAEEAVHGLLTEEQWDHFQVQGHRFIAAYNTAVDAFALWSQAKTQGNTARLESLLESLPLLLGDLKALVHSFEKKPEPEGQKPEVRSQESEEKGRGSVWIHPGRAEPALSLLKGGSDLSPTFLEAPWR